eukprot:361775-Chlamydomonas_euryale.AAC.16
MPLRTRAMRHLVMCIHNHTCMLPVALPRLAASAVCLGSVPRPSALTAAFACCLEPTPLDLLHVVPPLSIAMQACDERRARAPPTALVSASRHCPPAPSLPPASWNVLPACSVHQHLHSHA